MEIEYIPIENISLADWNANVMDESTVSNLVRSIDRFGPVIPILVRRVPEEMFEPVDGNHRVSAMIERGYEHIPCVIVDADNAEARLLSQALNRIHGEDDVGLRLQLLREVLESTPQSEVLGLLPESETSLSVLSELGTADMADHLEGWQKAQRARLRHMTLQLSDKQLEVVEEALEIALPQAKEFNESPNARGTAMSIICMAYIQKERP